MASVGKLEAGADIDLVAYIEEVVGTGAEEQKAHIVADALEADTGLVVDIGAGPGGGGNIGGEGGGNIGAEPGGDIGAEPGEDIGVEHDTEH